MAVIRWPMMKCSQSVSKWTAPWRKVPEHPYSLLLEQLRTMSGHPDNSHPDCFSSHPHSQGSELGAFHHGKTRTCDWCSTLSVVWTIPEAALGSSPDVPIWTGLWWVVQGWSKGPIWSQPMAPKFQFIDSSPQVRLGDSPEIQPISRLQRSIPLGKMGALESVVCRIVPSEVQISLGLTLKSSGDSQSGFGNPSSSAPAGVNGGFIGIILRIKWTFFN